jgi:hypothetical protein
MSEPIRRIDEEGRRIGRMARGRGVSARFVHQAFKFYLSLPIKPLVHDYCGKSVMTSALTLLGPSLVHTLPIIPLQEETLCRALCALSCSGC